MAYDKDGLHALHYADGFTLWRYRAPDNDGAHEFASGYFPDDCPIKSGDVVLVSLFFGGVPNGAFWGVMCRYDEQGRFSTDGGDCFLRHI